MCLSTLILLSVCWTSLTNKAEETIKYMGEECGVPHVYWFPYTAEHPWVAVISTRDSAPLAWQVPQFGTLITSRVVLAAAHYFGGHVTPEDYTVEFVRAESKRRFAVRVSSIVIHEAYNSSSSDSDLALLELERTVTSLERVIWPACVSWSEPLQVDLDGWHKVNANNITRQWIIVHETMHFEPRLACDQLLVASGLAVWDKNCLSSREPTLGYRTGGLYVEQPRQSDKFHGKFFLIGMISSVYNDTLTVYTDLELERHKRWMRDQVSRLDASGACMLPDPAGNREFARANCKSSSSCGLAPGTLVPQSQFITVTCTPDHFMVQGLASFVSRGYSSCQRGAWDPIIAECYKLCPPVTSQTVDFQCWQGPNLVNCEKPMLPDTVVTYRCKEYHESSDRNQVKSFKCGSDGQWSRQQPACFPKCGLSSLNSYELLPAIVGGNVSEPGNFPWHAAIFHNVSNSWEGKCGGTLISTRVVLTAAHCVTVTCRTCKSPRMDVQDVMVSLGKNRRQWNEKEANEEQRQVKQILVHPDYVGPSLNYDNDLALVVLEAEVSVSSFVMPACVDYDLDHLQRLSEPALEGYVAGWGLTEECGPIGSVCDKVSDELRYSRTTILNFTACFQATQKIKPFLFSRLTNDKICAGNGSESVVQKGDSGGGLTFVFGGKHHVYGVVSEKLRLATDKRVWYNFGAFTSVPYHINWLKSQL